MLKKLLPAVERRMGPRKVIDIHSKTKFYGGKAPLTA